MQGIEGGEQGRAFDLTGGAKPRCDAVEVAIVVARMADELPEPLRHGREQVAQGSSVQMSGRRDPDGAVCREDASLANLRQSLESFAKRLDQPDLQAAHKAAVTECEAPGFFERAANGADPGLLCDGKKWARDAGEDMCVLMGVEMRGLNARLLDTLDLRQGLACDLVFVDLAAQDGAEEAGERRPKAFAIGAEKRRNALRRRKRDAVGEDDMAANAQRRMRAGYGDGVIEGWAVGHQGGGRKCACLMQFENGAIDSARESEVVCVDDEAGSHEEISRATATSMLFRL